MERYDNIVKIEQIRKLADGSRYEKALEILDTMDTGKIKSLTDLSIIADVLTRNERYDEAMAVLTRMYSRTKTRRILYQLVELSIRRGNVPEAEEYLQIYVKAAPQDFYRYIFRYCIDKLKGEPYEALIASLEQLKEYEYIEKWAYELAKLYHKAGMKDKCVRECSDIVLWFGDGIYVEKARLLKGYYVGEINPIHMLKAKEKKDAEKKLGLDKTKDYSTMKSQIDRFLKEDETADTDEGNTASAAQEEMPPEADEAGSGIIPENEYAEEAEYDSGHNMDIKEEVEYNSNRNTDMEEETDRSEDTKEYETETEENAETEEAAEMFPAEEYGTSMDEVKPENITTGKLEQIFMRTGVDFEKIFGYFTEIATCREQIETCLESLLKDNTKSNGLSIAGDGKSGKTVLAKRFAKAFYCLNQITTTKVAKISAGKLNHINLESRSAQLADGTLIIEEAGQLGNTAVEQLLHLMWKLDGQLAVILEDNKIRIEELFKTHPELASEFRNHIVLPEYTKQDLFGFANAYIVENDYRLSDEAGKILLEKLDSIEATVDDRNRLEAVMNLIKEVKSVTDLRNKQELSGILGSGTLKPTDLLYIRGEDFAASVTVQP